MQIVYAVEMLGGAKRKRKRSNAREIGVGQLYWALSDNLIAKLLWRTSVEYVQGILGKRVFAHTFDIENRFQ